MTSSERIVVRQMIAKANSERVVYRDLGRFRESWHSLVASMKGHRDCLEAESQLPHDTVWQFFDHPFDPIF